MNIKTQVALLYFFSCIVNCCCAVTVYSQVQQQFVVRHFISKGDTLPYRLLYPKDYKPGKRYPMLVFLHGDGERGKDNEKQLVAIPKRLTDDKGRRQYACFILAPQCPKNQVWVKFKDFPSRISATPEPTSPARQTLALTAQLLDQLPIDRKRVYITGYSGGGEGTLDLLSRRPDLFAAAISLCPVVDTSKAALIANKPIWVFHGAQDQVNPIHYSEIAISAWKQNGGQPKFTVYPNLAHRIWFDAYQDPKLFPWLFKQRNR